jgi:AcrR family transcriptional regulator
MPRPSQRTERRQEYLPLLARTFAERGYRGTTTAVLAEACAVRENILYRLWPEKRSMFIAALDYVYALSEATWTELLQHTKCQERSPAELILDYEASHHGEFGLYRIVFAGLSETDDEEIAAALRQLYRRFHHFIVKQVKAHGCTDQTAERAWGIIGLGTMANIGRELGLLSGPARQRLMGKLGRRLLDE